MEQYVTSTQLKQELRRVKEYASNDVVHVLENGHAAYVLCSFEVFERRKREACERAIWKVRVSESVRSSAEDIDRGRMMGIEGALVGEVPFSNNVRITATAAEQLDLEFDGSVREIASRVMLDVVDQPDLGIAIEYDSVAGEQARGQVLRKVTIPPADVVYTVENDYVVILAVVPCCDLI